MAHFLEKITKFLNLRHYFLKSHFEVLLETNIWENKAKRRKLWKCFEKGAEGSYNLIVVAHAHIHLLKIP